MGEDFRSKLERKLHELERRVPELEASALVSVDGLMMVSALRAGMDEDRIAAMSAALLGVAERIGTELERGGFEMGIVSGERGYVVVTNVGAEAALVALADKEAKLGLLFYELKRTAEELARILGRKR